ncbi:MAG: TetR/AcrR family transcriptional regulator [Sphingobacteriales bacterium]|nr:MAG: TetR/AcrR family transcriptional regulator [Sphingobacteriales bacterium]
MYGVNFNLFRCAVMKDKEQTKRKLIDAVGMIIKTKGFSGLRISKVAGLAGVDRKLVYRYFGNLSNLTEAYIAENDYWFIFAEHFKILSKELDNRNIQAFITDVLQGLFKHFLNDKEMQNLILMELSGDNPIMRSIHNVRELIGQQLFEATDSRFQPTNVNFRAISALLVGGIYYMILHTRKNGYQFADVNLKSDEGMRAILDTMAQVIEWAFKEAV